MLHCSAERELSLDLERSNKESVDVAVWSSNTSHSSEHETYSLNNRDQVTHTKTGFISTL